MQAAYISGQEGSLKVNGDEALPQALIDVAEELLCVRHVCWRHAVHDLQHVQHLFMGHSWAGTPGIPHTVDRGPTLSVCAAAAQKDPPYCTAM